MIETNTIGIPDYIKHPELRGWITEMVDLCKQARLYF